MPPPASGAEPAAAVELREVWKSFGATPALAGVSLTVAEGEFFSLLGPSGCGKSTLLRLVAGLESPDRGEVGLHGAPARHLPAHRRPVNTVFQSYALFPHLSVEENIGFGLRMRGMPAGERRRRVGDAMALVRLDGLGPRRPEQLSGGQRQRVALARALVNEPRVLLLDEPLAALDRQLRLELRQELQALHQRTGITFLLVTHDQEEALSLSHRVAVLRSGRVVQCGTPRDLYDRPQSRFVAEFVGACNVWPGTLAPAAPSGCSVESPLGRLHLDTSPPGSPAVGPVSVGIRPEQVILRVRSAHDATRANCFAATVDAVRFEGAASEVRVRVGGTWIRCYGWRAPGAGAGEWRVGDPVTVELPPSHLMAWPVESA